jgi:tetratricopeptide (TPR) repeat protein
MWETARVIGEAWLLLGRRAGRSDLFQWAAWYLNLQRNYGEAALLLRTAARQNMGGPWLDFFRAIALVHEGDLNQAEDILRGFSGDAAPAASAANSPLEGQNALTAAALANLGRILEARRALARAIEYYERASALLLDGALPQDSGNFETCARVQLCIARCLLALGRPQESRRALEFALDLNPDNLNARLELDRLSASAF